MAYTETKWFRVTAPIVGAAIGFTINVCIQEVREQKAREEAIKQEQDALIAETLRVLKEKKVRYCKDLAEHPKELAQVERDMGLTRRLFDCTK